jgi:hypothetical protein
MQLGRRVPPLSTKRTSGLPLTLALIVLILFKPLDPFTVSLLVNAFEPSRFSRT